MNLDPQQIQQMIQLLQSMLPQQTHSPNNETNANDHEHNIKTKRKSRDASKKNSKPSLNKFDSMPERRMHKEDVAIDKKLSIQPPVPRARKFELVQAICRVCGKKEEVNPVLITDSLDRYKCNRCSGSAG